MYKAEGWFLTASATQECSPMMIGMPLVLGGGISNELPLPEMITN
jgi:hypothetical protein